MSQVMRERSLPYANNICTTQPVRPRSLLIWYDTFISSLTNSDFRRDWCLFDGRKDMFLSVS